jgi:hypothetical protein
MRPTAVIGDIHGLGYWKDIVNAHPNCRIIFLGDYLDPYKYVSRTFLFDNLQAIIQLKIERPDDIILLLGNHDLHYFCSDILPGSRFDMSIAEQASNVFRENIALFQYVFQEDKRIFVHAGISHQWFVEDFKGDLNGDIGYQLNHPTDDQVPALCRVGRLRGGYKGDIGGIFWADIDELDDPLHGYTQIVGHNRVGEVTEKVGQNDNKIVFCDCLYNGNYLMIDE